MNVSFFGEDAFTNICKADRLDAACQFERSMTVACLEHPRQCYDDHPPEVCNNPVVCQGYTS